MIETSTVLTITLFLVAVIMIGAWLRYKSISTRLVSAQQYFCEQVNREISFTTDSPLQNALLQERQNIEIADESGEQFTNRLHSIGVPSPDMPADETLYFLQNTFAMATMAGFESLMQDAFIMVREGLSLEHIALMRGIVVEHIAQAKGEIATLLDDSNLADGSLVATAQEIIDIISDIASIGEIGTVINPDMLVESAESLSRIFTELSDADAETLSQAIAASRELGVSLTEVSLEHGYSLVDSVAESTLESIDVSALTEISIPVFTILLSSIREIKLLDAGVTDGETATLNIALDAAGSGFGSLVGAKSGAAIGTVFAPGVGSVIGALLGGFLGAMSGRAASNHIKMMPANESRQAHEALYRDYDREKRDRIRNICERSTELLQKGHQTVWDTAGKAPHSNDEIAQFEQIYNHLDKSAREDILKAGHIVQTVKDQTVARYGTTHWYQRLWKPNKAAIMGILQPSLWKINEEIKQTERQIPKNGSSNLPLVSISQMANVPILTGGAFHNQLDRSLIQLRRFQLNRALKTKQWAEETGLSIQAMIEGVIHKIAPSLSELAEFEAKWEGDLRRSAEKVEKEYRKVGKKIRGSEAK